MKYIKPEIKAIEIDSMQAVLQVCSIAGMYITNVGPSSHCAIDPGMYACASEVKGKRVGWAGFSLETNLQSS